MPHSVLVGVSLELFLAMIEAGKWDMSVGICTRVKHPDIKKGALLPAFPEASGLDVQPCFIRRDSAGPVERFPCQWL